jgi:hypothetical protein
MFAPNVIFLVFFSIMSDRLLKILCLIFLLPACGDLSKPIDAETRRVIDSVSTSVIQRTRIEIDSAYKNALITKMPQVMDSIRQVRLREIENQLKNIPAGQ